MFLLPYPAGKRFAFTIVDDTDGATLENVGPVYECLRELGFRTTKTVWIEPPRVGEASSGSLGDTLQRRDYSEFVESLHEWGFEIALHNVTGDSNRREQVLGGLEAFRAQFGRYPRMNIQHEKNRENLYFDFAQDSGRLRAEFSTRAARWIQRAVDRTNGRTVERAKPHPCCGEDPDSPYFWGDLCRSRIQYVRTNVFLCELDTIRTSPHIPFHHDDTPWVNYWFDCSNGADRERFTELLRERQVRRLIDGCGCALVYTHFGKGFCEAGPRGFQLNPHVRRRLERIASRRDGWFAPASEVLDRLLAFHKVLLGGFPGGMLVENGNPYPLRSVTIWDAPRRRYWLVGGSEIEADEEGRIVLPTLSAGSRMALVGRDVCRQASRWNEDSPPGWRKDIGMLANKAFERLYAKLCHRRAWRVREES
ncbi:MAG: hypothetical protein J0L64_06445 [Acidobacteria bacterium]|nr:hypothetical protein [Acidobacteriota bacterium]